MIIAGPQAQVTDFHKTFLVPVRTTPGWPDGDRIELRRKLVTEEYEEFLAALEDRDFPETIDALCDLLYVIYGSFAEFGVIAQPVFDEVHRSNMSKADENGRPVMRADGKVLKSLRWTPPAIKEQLRRQGWDG